MSTPALPFLVTNNAVTHSVVDGSTLYIAGGFSEVGPNTGSFAAIGAVSGKAAASLPRVDGSVDSLVPDHRGGWYIAGYFTHVGGVARHGLARIEASGKVDPHFHPRFAYALGLQVSPDGKTLFAVAGIKGKPYGTVLAISSRNGAIRKGFHVKTDGGTLLLSPDGKILYVSALEVPGTRLQDRLAAVNVATGKTIRTFLKTGSGVTCLPVLSPDGRTLYAVRGNSVSAWQPWDGSLNAWNARSGAHKWARTLTASGAPAALAVSPDGGTIYIGGFFTKLDKKPRAHLAAFRAGNGSLTTFDIGTQGLFPGINPAIDGNVTTLTTVKPGTLYIGGGFTSLGGQPRNGLGAIATAKAQVTGWNPHANGTVVELATANHGRTIAAGGDFNSIGSVTRDGLAAINLSTGAIEPFAPTFGFNGQLGEIDALALSHDGGTLYVGGHIDKADGQNRDGLAAFSNSDGSLTSFAPAVENVNALAVSPDNSTIYAAGLNALEALSVSNGTANWSDPMTEGPFSALALSSDGQTLYAGGGWQPSLVALSSATGNPVQGFDPPLLVTDQTDALALSPDGSTLYAGGTFSLGNPSTAHGLVGFDPATGAPTFEPTLDGNPKTLALTADGRHLFVGGNFGSLDQTPRSGIAEIDLANGATLTSFAPLLGGALGDGGVDTIALQGSLVVIGGDFTRVNDQARKDLALFTGG